MEGEFKSADRIDSEDRKQEWIRYYSKKRIYEQLLQVQMLQGLPIDTILEIGPYYGFVTAMLDNAGYQVTTMDMIPRSFERPDRPHIEMDLTNVDIEKLKGFDCIMCCATLEHIHFDQAQATLRTFRDTGARYVLISVPFQGTQLFFQIYWNRYIFHEHLSFKKLRFLRPFEFDSQADPYGHKWEIGYKGCSLKQFEKIFEQIGFNILKRDFSYPSYCVLHMLEATGRSDS